MIVGMRSRLMGSVICRNFCSKRSRSLLSAPSPRFTMSQFSPAISQLVRLLDVIGELRRKCPWDREQSLADVPKYLIEEAYETADAIAQPEAHKIADELGDLLVQVFFAAIIAEEEGR